MENTIENKLIDYSPTVEGTRNRRNLIPPCDYLFQNATFENIEVLKGNIENFIGMTMVPTGLIGPVKVNGNAANGAFFVPLATSEGALVASYHRGAKACYEAGGATSICLTEGVQRSPVFKFNNLGELGSFLIWVSEKITTFKEITTKSSRFAQLKEMTTNIEGNHLILTFDYHTGDASGQNMVTFCTENICQYIIKFCPTKPILWFIEGNYSGDKKATTRSFSQVRGKRITTEIVLPKDVIEKTLKTTPKAMFDYWLTSTMGVIQSGAIGAQGHYANGLAAIFLATGQDVACVSESSVGLTRMEVLADGSLYVSVTLPNLMVGTIGGGTSLPTQKECLQMMDCYGVGKARKFAEIIGAVLLAGELSIAAALSAGHFSNAHKQLGRKSA
jgi:hydroxymethylglutaryl-CoA reductase (NADPH)